MIKYRKINLETYKPKSRVELDHGTTIPIFSFICRELIWFGGFILVIFAGIFMSSKGILELKKKIRHFQQKREKVVDFGRNRHRRLIRVS